MRWYRNACSALAALILLSGCGGKAAPSGGTGSQSSPPRSAGPAALFPVTLTDDDGVSVTMDAAPQRIVTFSPADTEILFALGLGSRVVGVSGSFDHYPAAASKIQHIGGSSGIEPNVEKVVALHPDVLITYGGGQAWKTKLRDLDVPVFSVDSSDFDDLLHDIDTVGTLTGTEPAALGLTTSMRKRAAAIQAAVSQEPAVTCFFEVYYPPLSTVGPGSFIYDLLQRAGCDPVTKDAKSAYPEWSADRLIQDDPEVYLVGSAPGVSAAAIAKRPGFGSIGAVKDGKVFVIDSDLVTRNGPRIVDGLSTLANALHPGT